MSVRAQKENFSQMIASPFNLELHYKSWESAMRGNNVTMNKLHDTLNDMLAAKNKPDTVDTNREIVFSVFHDGKATSLNAQEFRFYSQTLIDLKTLPSIDRSGPDSAHPILPYYNKDDAAFMPHKYIPHTLWHRACEVLYQALLKFYRQPYGAQLPGHAVIKGF